MFQFTSSAEEDHQVLIQCLQQLQQDYSVTPGDLVDFKWKNFSLLHDYSNLLNRQTLKIQNKNVYILFAEVEREVVGRYDTILIKEFRFFVVCFLNKSFGHILIRKEKLEDKINEYFNKTQLNFPGDDLFNKRFYVLATEEDKALSLLDKNFRNELVKVDKTENLLVEVVDNLLLICNNKMVDLQSFEELVRLGNNLSTNSY
ncbi:MAG: hypothetical protein ACJ749_13055 [Flavisolibacter sp.]